MQCASSTATSGMAMSRSEPAEALEDQALRGDVDERVLALGHARHPAPDLLAVEGGGEEGRAHVRARSRAWTWSFIKATSGEMTSVVPPSDTAGSW